MAKSMTISEICRFVGIAPHTLRFYERHFPSLLTADRTVGGHRIYSPNQLENLKKILKCIKEEKHSIKETQQRLEESVEGNFITSQKKTAVDEIPEIPFSNALEMVMKKLDELFSHNVRMDKLIEKLILERNSSGQETLLRQISSLRKENREVFNLLELFKSRASERSFSPPLPSSGDKT